MKKIGTINKVLINPTSITCYKKFMEKNEIDVLTICYGKYKMLKKIAGKVYVISVYSGPESRSLSDSDIPSDSTSSY